MSRPDTRASQPVAPTSAGLPSTARLLTIVLLSFNAAPALAIDAGQVDDFENGTVLGWTEGGQSPNDPVNVSTGGPQGAGDNYLRNVSSGAAGAGGKMVMFNTGQWTGNYGAEDVESIRAWLVNEGNTAMSIRIAMRSGTTWFVTSNAFALPADDVWRQATFDLNDSAMTRVQGAMSLSDVLANVGELRIHCPRSHYLGDARRRRYRGRRCRTAATGRGVPRPGVVDGRRRERGGGCGGAGSGTAGGAGVVGGAGRQPGVREGRVDGQRDHGFHGVRRQLDGAGHGGDAGGSEQPDRGPGTE